MAPPAMLIYCHPMFHCRTAKLRIASGRTCDVDWTCGNHSLSIFCGILSSILLCERLSLRSNILKYSIYIQVCTANTVTTSKQVLYKLWYPDFLLMGLCRLYTWCHLVFTDWVPVPVFYILGTCIFTAGYLSLCKLAFYRLGTSVCGSWCH